MSARPATRPNLLVIMADQMAAPFLTPWGGPAKTPTIERLAAEGVVFDTTYSPSPLCAPARFAMMTGQRNSRIGAYDNASELPSSIPTLAHYLRLAGYQTSLVGKMHFVGPDQLHGFEERLTTDIYPADFGWTPNWQDPDGRFDWWYHNLDSVVHAGVAEATNQLDFDDDVGYRSIRKLRDLARTSDDRPWMMTASFTHPHDPYVARQDCWDRYKAEEIPLPHIGGTEVEADRHSERLRRVICADTTPLEDEQIRNARHAYLANCSYIDDWVGRLLSALSALRLSENTVVIFTADHGDMLGERGLWYKMNFFEASARVPLIMSCPGRFAPRRSSTLTSLLDLAPTLLELAGVDLPSDFDGHSLVPQLDGDEDAERWIEGEYLGEGAVAPIVMLRKGSKKYIFSEPDGAQLYDLHSDPYELANLASTLTEPELLAWSAEVNGRWDLALLREQVVSSQERRRTVDAALRKGRYSAWDFQPTSDAANEYMRNHLDLNWVEQSRRAP